MNTTTTLKLSPDALASAKAVIDTASRPPFGTKPIRACSLAELLKCNLPDPQPIIAPYLHEAELLMVYGGRGCGKTWFALSLAYAIAAGGEFLGKRVEKPRKVLYLDSEMRASRMRARLAMIVQGMDSEADDSMLQLLTRDVLPASTQWPDMGDEEGREAIAALIESALPEVIVIDNLSGWIRSGAGENDEESWRDMASFLMTQRSRGRAVVIVHHAGKGGQQRGTSKREDILDTVLKLKRPDDYDQTDGLRCELHFEKARNLEGGEIEAVAIRLDTSDGKAQFTVEAAAADSIDQVHALISDGATRKEIEQSVGLNRFQLMRLGERAAEQGRGFALPDARKQSKALTVLKGQANAYPS
jgi:KaiC/GvpD/RAD55 family RecA-like ATPase